MCFLLYRMVRWLFACDGKHRENNTKLVWCMVRLNHEDIVLLTPQRRQYANVFKIHRLSASIV